MNDKYNQIRPHNNNQIVPSKNNILLKFKINILFQLNLQGNSKEAPWVLFMAIILEVSVAYRRV
jgi:hypothetical protein